MNERQPPKSQPSDVRRTTPRMTIAGRVRSILATRNLTLYRIAALTRANYPKQTNYHLPRNLYFQIRAGRWSPTIEQLVALSQASGYRLADWLAVFDFRLDDIPRLQMSLRHPRTALLDSKVYARQATIPWFRDRKTSTAIPPIAPLSQLLEFVGPQRITAVSSKGAGPYWYAKIGQRDAYAFPDLAPGSIVRADSRFTGRFPQKANHEISKSIFLAEHSRGVCCCRLHFGTKNRITLTATELPFANVELQQTSQVRILGIVDMELRPLSYKRPGGPLCTEPEVARDLTRFWTPEPLDQRLLQKEPAFLIRSARRRAGLSLRQASEMSRDIARILAEERYFVSPGSLSEYEASSTPPRHIHKLLTLCILYCIRFEDLLDGFGLQVDESRMATIGAESLVPGMKSGAEASTRATQKKISTSGFLANVVDIFGEVPLFLRHSLPVLSGHKSLSLRDVFWVGGQGVILHPSLRGALFVICDRRKRRPRIFPRKSSWKQPIYLVRKRDGSYRMASCSMEDEEIVLHPYTDEFVPPERLHKTAEAEIVGQIVTILRSVPSPP
jgi:transcriptional regulator with XRE-family HTH domain